MMIKGLEKDITYLKGVGEKRAKLYEKLGIKTVYDLLYHFPRSYIDYSSPVPISQAILDENNIIHGTITKKFPPSMIRKGMTIYKAIITDYESDITITIYNSEFLFDKLVEGESYSLYGKVTGNFIRKEISSPTILSDDVEEKIQPIYSLTEGLSLNLVQNAVRNALKVLDDNIYEPMPKSILAEYGLCSLQYALKNIHFPQDMKAYEIAKKRLVFDEFFLLQLGMAKLKGNNRELSGAVMKDKDVSEYYKALPFELTNAQKNAINACLNDMCGKYPMNRLVQGDVGSGKTAVAAACCYMAHKNSYQSALMAPTDILATQHYNTLTNFLEPLGVKVCLLKGSLTPKKKALLKEEIKNGEYSVIVGTHALVQQTTEFKKLGLVITDEQHRFGVEQRSTLAHKGENPHTLVMSATPIPRTLALMIYGDLDISILDELPKGRQPVETYAVTGKLRERALNFIKSLVEEGRQGYIVCPMIEDCESDLQAVTTYVEKLKTTCLKDLNIGLLHGKLTPAQKDKVMQDFKDKKLDILVSTTVVEVGVDVPNAVVMLIENADRFGLSQLHQLRGRVGRGEYKSYCILVTDNVNEESRERLKILSRVSDGFKISEEDLKLRGPGDFFGSRQHGLPQLKIADMTQDITILKSAQEAAHRVFKEDRTLSKPENKHISELINRLFEKSVII
jgi:ATP-dependent DNA helicase RecG